MKKTAIVIMAAVIALAATLAACGRDNKDVIRIHIRANSNETLDQNVKYKVKDEVCAFLSGAIENAKNKAETYAAISENLDGIKSAADNALRKLGVDYVSKARLKKEEFPARDYGGKTYEAGVYDALIVELGSGTGDNWWCVIYPKLCFSPTGIADGFEYDSKIRELFDKNGGDK